MTTHPNFIPVEASTYKAGKRNISVIDKANYDKINNFNDDITDNDNK